MTRQQIIVGGATGKRFVSPQPTTLIEQWRSDVCAAIAGEYSYAEILEFAAAQQRDRERRQEVEDLFAECSGSEGMEELCGIAYQWQLAKRREARGFTRPYKSRSLAQQLTNGFKSYYERLLDDPVRLAARRATDRRRYERWRADPALAERRRRQGRESARRHKTKRAAAHKAWWERIKIDRDEAYQRRAASWRRRTAEAYRDPERREKLRKASRESHARKRARLKQEPAAYRAVLDARNAKRASSATKAGRLYRHASPRWSASEARDS